MTTYKISPQSIHGNVLVPSSKSMGAPYVYLCGACR